MRFAPDEPPIFDRESLPSGFRECILWDGATTDARGYGVMRWGGRTQLAHRVAYQQVFGAIAPGLFVCHHCDVPACVNPFHLFVGDQRANMRDMVRKGRMGRNPSSEKTHCPQGHPYDEKNTYRASFRNARFCRACLAAYARRRRLKQKAMRA